jgi:hypothetical protein
MAMARKQRPPARKRASPQPRSQGQKPSPLGHAVRLIRRVCHLAGSKRLVDDVRASLEAEGVRDAIRSRDTAALFDWLVRTLSFQGISDRVAAGYMERHGRVTWQDIASDLGREPSCPKLQSFWHFQDCRYNKTRFTCNEPDHIARCSLPTFWLRNGRLNQTAYSLYLFIRDVAGGDLAGWIDQRLVAATEQNSPNPVATMRQALLDPLREVYGVSDKVLTMALSELLLAAPRPYQRRWQTVGASMIAVDTLVHNFLHRTGILRRFGADHAYGPACYRHDGCAEIIERVANHIDARQFNPRFPQVFPRFVQFAIWRYCAQDGLDICNGNQIDDQKRCNNKSCLIYSICDRKKLINATNTQ